MGSPTGLMLGVPGGWAMALFRPDPSPLKPSIERIPPSTLRPQQTWEGTLML